MLTNKQCTYWQSFYWKCSLVLHLIENSAHAYGLNIILKYAYENFCCLFERKFQVSNWRASTPETTSYSCSVFNSIYSRPRQMGLIQRVWFLAFFLYDVFVYNLLTWATKICRVPQPFLSLLHLFKKYMLLLYWINEARIL